MGKQIGATHIEARIAKGPLASVYRGKRGGQPVALKVYRSDLPRDSWAARIERERQVQQAVSHPCVAKLVEYGEHDGALFLASEWIEGERLEDKLAGEAVPWTDFQPIFQAVVRGLGAMESSTGTSNRRTSCFLRAGSRRRCSWIAATRCCSTTSG